MNTTIAYYFAFAALGLVGASLGPTLPGLAEQTHVQLNQISFLFTARSLGYLLGSFLGGRLYDRFSGHPLMGLALILMAGAMALVPVAPLLWVLTVVLLLIGAGEGALDVGGNTLIVWLHGRKVGPVMNGLHFFFGAGAFLAPILVAQMALVSGGIAWAYWLIALLVLPAGLWMLRLPGPKTETVRDENGSKPINYRLTLLVAAFFILYVGAEVSFGGWIFSYAMAAGLANRTTAAYLTSGFWIAFAAARLLSIPVAARLRPHTVLMIDFAGSLLSLGIMLLYPDNQIVLWIGTLGVGLFIASIFPTMLIFAGQQMAVTGKVTGYFFLGATVGAMFLPWLIGQFFERVGPGFMIGALLVDMTLAAMVLGTLVAITGKGHFRDFLYSRGTRNQSKSDSFVI